MSEKAAERVKAFIREAEERGFRWPEGQGWPSELLLYHLNQSEEEGQDELIHRHRCGCETCATTSQVCPATASAIAQEETRAERAAVKQACQRGRDEERARWVVALNIPAEPKWDAIRKAAGEHPENALEFIRGMAQQELYDLAIGPCGLHPRACWVGNDCYRCCKEGQKPYFKDGLWYHDFLANDFAKAGLPLCKGYCSACQREQRMCDALNAIRIALKEPAGGEYHTARKLADKWGIFHEDLAGERVLLRLAQEALK